MSSHCFPGIRSRQGAFKTLYLTIERRDVSNHLVIELPRKCADHLIRRSSHRSPALNTKAKLDVFKDVIESLLVFPTQKARRTPVTTSEAGRLSRLLHPRIWVRRKPRKDFVKRSRLAQSGGE